MSHRRRIGSGRAVVAPHLPTLAVAVGTAPGMTATTRLMLTPIVFSAPLVGHNGLDTVSAAAVFAAAAAWITVAVFDRRAGPARER